MSEADCSSADLSNHTRILKEELKRRRMSADQLATYLQEHHGIDCPARIIKALLANKPTSLPADERRKIIKIVQALPPPPRVALANPSRLAWIPITAEMRSELNALFEETGLDAAFLVRRYKSPDSSLTTTTISQWRTGQAKLADPAEWQYLLELLNTFKSSQPVK